MHAQPFIAVRDVEASSAWYLKLLGGTNGHPDSPEYANVISNGKVVLHLHEWDGTEDEFDRLMRDPDAAPHGHGVLLLFVLDDFDEAVGRARELGVEVLLDICRLPGGLRTFALRDPDGYTVVIGGDT
jgi:predicted enzyme related to lactoylglutathione lyase